MASCSGDNDFPPGIFGTWITQEQSVWASDYHLNYNHNAPFYALYSANRIEQAEPYWRPLLAFVPRGKYYSEKALGIADGVLYPVGIGTNDERLFEGERIRITTEKGTTYGLERVKN
jgi:hypothetical protein